MSDQDKPTILLEYYLKKLRLPTMLREYASMAVVCQKDRTDFPTYLLRLAEREVLDREKRAAEKRVKDAGSISKRNPPSMNNWFERCCGVSTSIRGKTSWLSETLELAKPIWLAL